MIDRKLMYEISIQNSFNVCKQTDREGGREKDKWGEKERVRETERGMRGG